MEIGVDGARSRALYCAQELLLGVSERLLRVEQGCRRRRCRQKRGVRAHV
jgi:hypothetical protein